MLCSNCSIVTSFWPAFANIFDLSNSAFAECKSFVYNFASSPDGGIAQLGERLHGMQEVSGSIPLTSTTLKKQL